MKKVLMFLLIFSGVLLSQELNGIKLYINPGHGGFDSNDRYIATTGFWESQSNLDKGLVLRDMLTKLGATVIMSRTQNRTEDDRPLSEIVADANANNVDYFHSIHSNAFNGNTNYVLILYQGKDNAPSYPASKVMAGYVYDEIATANRLKKNYTGQNIRGDFDFYGTGAPYLGIFKGQLGPATLSEGSFHDYIPESFRLMNGRYKTLEAWAIAKAFLSFFGKPGFGVGEIAGIVRDPDQVVEYPYNGSYGDAKKPLNNIKMTLEPGGKVYNGDALNNGFFMFDSLMPGEYKVFYEKEGYYKDSTLVTVTANKTVFADKFLSYDTTLAPVVLSRTPQSGASTTIAPIVVTFDRKMSAEDVEKAFSISPAATGKFTWGEERIFVFTPTIPLQTSTQYTVTLSTDAKSKWGVPVGSAYTFSFTTNNRRQLVFEKSYPADNQKDISTTVQFRLQFDKPIGSAGGAIFLYDKDMKVLPVAGAKTLVENNKGVIYFEPKSALEIGMPYKVIVLGNLADTDGYPLIDTLKINFVTLEEQYVSGTVVDSFETAGTWRNPGWGSGTTGVDTLKSSFRITYSKKLFGKNSARLAYEFTQAGNGVCQFYNTAGIDILGGSASEFGMWVWSDLSYNILEYWFSADGTDQKITADTLNWSGWRLCRIPVSSIPGTAKKFHSIVVRQSEGGTKSSILYVDDAQYDIVLPVAEGSNEIPSKFNLEQNFPNPFNPSTKIRFSIPGSSEMAVRLSVFDVLGKEIAVLVNGKMNAGTHEVHFGADNLPSGIYIYKLQYGSSTMSRKMMLLK